MTTDTTTEALPGTQPGETPPDHPHPVERGLIILPDGTQLPFSYDAAVVAEPTVDLTAAVEATITLGRRLGFVARAALRDARALARWLLVRGRATFDSARARTREWQRQTRYRGRHHVERRWFGRTRSTAEVTGAFHRNYRAGFDVQEDDLPVPVYWVGWTYRVMEVMRAYDEALHPTTHHRFVCS